MASLSFAVIVSRSGSAINWSKLRCIVCQSLRPSSGHELAMRFAAISQAPTISVAVANTRVSRVPPDTTMVVVMPLAPNRTSAAGSDKGLLLRCQWAAATLSLRQP